MRATGPTGPYFMNYLVTSFAAVAAAFCLLCAVALRRWHAGPLSPYLGCYLATKAATFTLVWLISHPDTPFKSLWLGLFLALAFFMAPCLWLFARDMSGDRARHPARMRALDGVIVVSGIVATIPLMLSAHGGALMVDPARPAQGAMASLIHEGMLIAIGLFAFQVPWYARRWRRLIDTQAIRDAAIYSNPAEMPLRILRASTWLLGTHWLATLCHTLATPSGVLHSAGPLLILLETGIALSAVGVIFRQLFTAPPGHSAAKELVPEVANAESEQSSYAKSALDQKARERIAAKLAAALEDEQLYRQPSLKLADLCAHINESAHYVSQVINQHLGCTFYELINRRRIEVAAGRLLAEPGKTILDIAMETGFNAKSTFNAAFKRHIGMTPSDYRNEAARREV